METQDKGFDLRRFWWVFRKNLVWILIAAVLASVVFAVATKVLTKTTYTVKSTFVVEKTSTGTTTSTTEYYEGLTAKEDAEDIVEIIGFVDTVRDVMEKYFESVGEKPTEAKTLYAHKAISAKVSNDSSRFVQVTVKAGSSENVINIAQALETYLPAYISAKYPDMNVALTLANKAELNAKKDADGNPVYIDEVQKDANGNAVLDLEGNPVVKKKVVAVADGVPVLRNAALGGVLVMLAVYLIFFLIESLDNTIHGHETLAERFPEIPVIGQIPQWSNKNFTRRQRKLERQGRLRDYEEKLLSDDTPFSVAESFRTLRANVSYMASGKSTVIGITSVKTGECKSVVSTNLAYCYAQLKKKVLLIEGDMRLPAVHEICHITPENGLPEVLAGIETDFHKCLHRVHDYMDVLPVGQLPPNPAELLASDTLTELFKKLREEYDLIVVDLPPLGTVSDAGIISREVDHYLVSTRVEVTNAKMMNLVLRDMERLEMKVGGFVISGIDDKGRYSKSPYYYDKYGVRQRKGETSVATTERTNN